MKIAVINTSKSYSCLSEEPITRNIELLRSNNIEVTTIQEFQDPEDRAAVLLETLARTDLDYTWAAQGGIETIELLPHLEFVASKINNIMIGSSDFTHIASGLNNAGLPVYYGPNFKSIPERKLPHILDLLENGVTNTHLKVTPLFGEFPSLEAVQGGTLMVILNLLGTYGLTSYRDRVLFMEHHYMDGEIYPVAKYWLTILKNKISQLQPKGLLFGKIKYTENGVEATEDKQKDLIREVFHSIDIPVAYCETGFKSTLMKLQ